MKKKSHYYALALITVLIIGCGEKKNATSKDNVSTSNTPAENVETGTKQPENYSQITISKNDPPKYANKADLMEHLVQRSNVPEVGLTQEQIDQIYALADETEITVFKDHYTYNKFRKKVLHLIKTEVFTPEQVRLYPVKSKKSD